MSRKAREKSKTKIYHVMLRGINRQQIFEDREDYEKFIEILEECKGISGYKLYAYCLMGNHVHLLIKEEQESIEQIFKRIGGRYVYWYNTKYQRVGHLFQDRFKSEPVETDEYLLTVVRYIHQNPMKAGLSKKVETYPYSSYTSYLKHVGMIDKDLMLSLISLSQFEEYHQEICNDKCLDIETNVQARVTDEQATKIIYKISKCKSSAEFQELDVQTRNK